MPNDPYQIGDTDSGITLVLSDRGVGVAAAHAIEHVTGGNDKIRDATTTLDGLMTAAQALKLSNIEENAQVTSAARIATALGGVGTESTLASDDFFPFLDTSAASALKRITTTNFITFLGGSLVNIGGTQAITGTKTFTNAVFTSATINGGSVNATINLGTNPFTGLLPVNKGGTGVSTSTGTGSVVLSSGPVLVTPTLGTPTSSSFLTNCSDLPIVGGTTGTLTVTRGGTGATSLTGVVKGTGTGALTASPVGLASADVTGTLPVANGGTGSTSPSTGSGGVVLATSPTLSTPTFVAPTLGTPAAGSVLTNCTGLPIVAGTTGTLTVARGGTGFTANPFGQLSGQTPSVTTFDSTVYLKRSLTTTLNALSSGFVADGVDGRLKYTGTETRNFLVTGSTDVFTETSGAEFSVKLYKHTDLTNTGALIDESQCNANGAGNATHDYISKLSTGWIIPLATNDWVELHVQATSNNVGNLLRMKLVATPV